MSQPKVSAVTSCYRAEKYIKVFLEKLPEQTFFDDIQIVMDHNEPSEYELECIKDFQSRYPGKIKHLTRDKVVGYSVSINTCFEAADGEFLAIWNMDDLRTPNSIEKQYEALAETDDVGLVYGDTYTVSRFGETQGKKNKPLIAPAEWKRSMVGGPHFMFRKSLCEKAGLYDEQFVSGADFDFCIRLAMHTKFKYIPVTTGYFLCAHEGLSTRADTTQPVERTVIELRYGIYDKILYEYLPGAARYNIPYILQKGEWRHITDYVPDWQETLYENAAPWLYKGLCKEALLKELRPLPARIIRECKEVSRKVIGAEKYNILKSYYHNMRKTLGRS